jgi:prepilin-type N-terminal cleavage/methylation domain-containing protein
MELGLSLIKQDFSNESGFTLIEALVAMVIFSIGFSGLYFFFATAQQSTASAEKQMYLNLMADRIIETISAESRRASTDILNPFVTPTTYSGSLTSCVFSDVRQSWCLDLNTAVGPYNAASGLEVRQVDVINDISGLIVNVSLVTDGGKVRTYFTRKIRKAS